MSVTDDRRIEDLERLARSLMIRVDRLELRATPRQIPVMEPQPAGHVGVVPLPYPRSEQAPTSAATPSTPPRHNPGTRAAPGQKFEDLLGGRMLAWLGGVAVVVGIALFFAYAISRGWIGESARVAGGGIASLALLAFGVWLHEHRGRTDAARTTVAVAVAGLFITIVVASRVYAVIPVSAGIIVALAAGAAGATLAIRWHAKVIGAIGIVGALLAPVMVGATGDGATLVILFCTALSAVGVLLWRRWMWLGFAVLLVCAPQWLAWLLTGPSLLGTLAVLVAFGALGLVAAIGFELRLPSGALRVSSCFLLVMNAAVLAFAGHSALDNLGHPEGAALWIGALALAHLTLALLVGRLPRVAADIRLVLLTLGVLLGDVAFALLAHGTVLATGLAAASVLFARLASARGRRPRGQALAEAGLGGHLFGALLVAVGQSVATGPLSQANGDQLGATIALAAVAAAAFTSARLAGTSAPPWRAALDIVALGTTAFVTAIDVHGVGLILAWALEAVALARIARRTSNDVAGLGSLAFLAGAAFHALAVEAPPRALALGVPGLAAASAALGACAVAGLAVAHAKLAIAERDVAPALIGAASLALLYLASILIVSAFQPATIAAGDAVLDLTVRQQGQMLLSGLWGVAGVGALILGLRRDQRLLRLGALGVLLVTAGKVFLYDLSTLNSVYRVASFIALGLLLLAGAYAYQRLRPPPAPDLRTVPRALR